MEFEPPLNCGAITKKEILDILEEYNVDGWNDSVEINYVEKGCVYQISGKVGTKAIQALTKTFTCYMHQGVLNVPKIEVTH